MDAIYAGITNLPVNEPHTLNRTTFKAKNVCRAHPASVETPSPSNPLNAFNGTCTRGKLRKLQAGGKSQNLPQSAALPGHFLHDRNGPHSGMTDRRNLSENSKNPMPREPESKKTKKAPAIQGRIDSLSRRRLWSGVKNIFRAISR
jgi:hypothetical protein